MKLKCKTGFKPATNGILGIGAKPRRPIKGLTEGNTYTGELVPAAFSVLEGTRIDESDICAMLYNDEQEWECYDLNLFEPI